MLYETFSCTWKEMEREAGHISSSNAETKYVLNDASTSLYTRGLQTFRSAGHIR
jgi:hypothetical protein